MSDKKEKWKKIVEEAEKRNTKKEEIAESPVKEDKPDPKPSKGRVTNAKLVNIRQEPSPNATIIATATEGTVFEILGHVPNYFKIRFVDGNKETPAYINAGYFSANIRTGG